MSEPTFHMLKTEHPSRLVGMVSAAPKSNRKLSIWVFASWDLDASISDSWFWLLCRIYLVAVQPISGFFQSRLTCIKSTLFWQLVSLEVEVNFVDWGHFWVDAPTVRHGSHWRLSGRSSACFCGCRWRTPQKPHLDPFLPFA